MMIIKTDKERQEAGISNSLCPICWRDLATQYPLLRQSGTNHTIYHLSCALQLASEICAEASDYLIEQDLKPLDYTPTPMEQIFHQAREARPHPQ